MTGRPIDRKRITSNGIHHFVTGATHDKDDKIREVFVPEGFKVVQLIGMSSKNYGIRIYSLSEMKKFLGRSIGEWGPEALGPLAVFQHFFEVEGRYISNAVFSRPSDTFGQVCGNMYREK
jgi:hypothetical protein